MNLQKLFELQRQLDEHIEKEHPRQPGEDRLAKKILALQVELGELCNCWRGFKFWSHGQEPTIFGYKECPCGIDYGTCDEYGCADGLLAYNPLLEEYVDCLHFILSIGIEFNQMDVDSWFVKHNISVYKSHDVIKQFNDVFKYIQDFYEWRDDESYEELFYGYFALGEMLGFSWQEIEEAYLQKNAVNHQRQESGY
ncbi:dUTP diphosphatase [Anoxybacillus rupiensis]|uniref:dUTP diphosphatase n=1 Tax=Anoxybacteroides rupiense TaxID=311460 RepID=A0ABD5IQZ7_9BACL|nr:dUTP diphosphatase [Anoxybacillus rupiensis]